MKPSGPIVLSEGEGDVVADVWFVHGLRGDALETWSKGKICWPRDLLKLDLKNARIITWGYDSSVLKATGPASQASIFGHADNLLMDMSMKRRTLDEGARAIIFVGHSLGGLVIKEALIRSSEYLHNQQNPARGAIYEWTKGIVFLGTPHRGSSTAGLAQIVSNVAKITLQNPNQKLVAALEEDSDILERQRKSFASICQDIQLACVSEELPTSIGLIVPERSASIDGFQVETASIPANHMNMCRFDDSNDIGYQRVSYFITSFVSHAAKAVARGKKPGSLVSTERQPSRPRQLIQSADSSSSTTAAVQRGAKIFESVPEIEDV